MADESPPPPPPPTLKRWLRRLRPFVAVALLALVLRRVDLRSVGGLLLGTDPWLLAAAALCAALSQAIAAERLRLLGRRRGLVFGWGEACRINLAASFYGMALPAGNVTGGFVRMQRMRREGGSLADALVAMATDRFLATLALGIAGVALVAVARGPRPPAAVAVLLGATAALVAALVLWRLLPRLPDSRLRRLVARTSGGGDGAGAGAPALVTPGPVALSLVAHAAGIAGFVCLARATGIDAPALALGWIRCLMLLLVLLPISIAGLGVRDTALVVLLAPFGVPASHAFTLALLVFLVTVLAPALVGGVVEAVYRGEG